MTKMRFFITAILVSLVFFSGCGSQKSVNFTPKKAIPAWYAKPPLVTTTTLYAIGEAQNKDEAIVNALNNMASTLSVSIGSQFTSREVVEDGIKSSHQVTSSNEIQSDVKKLRISNYEVLDSKELGFRKYIVLIKSDKQKLFNSLKNEVDQKFAFIDKQKETIARYHAIKQLTIYKKAKSDIADVPNTLIIMNVLNESFDSKEYVNKVEAVNSNYDKLLSSITFTIQSNTEAKDLEASIKKGLTAKELQVQYNTGKKHFILIITSKIDKASTYGFTLARAAINIIVRDYRGSIIGSNKLNIVGQSTQGYNVAKENVAIKLNEMIKKDGIGKVIGLDL
ncbi:MAG: LPP20 family lipoprotein [Sulfurimonas sp.]|nr:LPP20 family lipoprotein [Sulfurimonas sp.]